MSESPGSGAVSCYTIFESPIGPLILVARGGRLSRVLFAEGSRAAAPPRGAVEDGKPLSTAAWQLEQYFAGERTAFDLPIAPEGTNFQKQVWRQLLTIPFGETRSYAQIAAAIGRPEASRAVGSANGRNPLPIVLPCHRVIGSSGSLTGFGGGLDTKRWLLQHERQRSLSFGPG